MKAPINRWLHATRRIWTATFAAAAVLTLGTPAAAQDAPKPLEPEYANSLFLLDSSGSLKPLERQPVGVGGKGRVLGFGAMGVSYEIQNEHSPIRAASSAPPEIVVKLEDRDVDTATHVLLYPLRIAKRKRQILISGAGFMAIHTKSDLQSTQLQMVFAKYGQASLKITPASPLAPENTRSPYRPVNSSLQRTASGLTRPRGKRDAARPHDRKASDRRVKVGTNRLRIESAVAVAPHDPGQGRAALTS